MKKIYLLFTLFTSMAAFSQTTYPGNGNDGFGGQVGKGSVAVSDNGSVITFVFNKGTGEFNDALVFYIDSKSGGFNSTAGFLDQGDPLRKAISGVDGDNRSVLTFSLGFEPDYAIALDKGFAGVWALQGGSTEHTYIASANLTPTNNNLSPTYTLTVNKADIGLTGAISFTFFGTYTSESAYRSNEAIGDLMLGFTSGWNNQTILTYNIYGSILPVKLTGFNAVKDKNGVLLNWSVAQENYIDNYQVQRSKDGVNFSTIQTVKARNLSAYQPAYSASDRSPAKGVNYYRLLISENGRSAYSGVVAVTITQAGDPLVISYVPGTTILNVRLAGLDAGVYALSVVNTAGQLLQSISLNHDGGDVNKAVSLKNGLSKGIYRVVLTGDNSRSTAGFLVP